MLITVHYKFESTQSFITLMMAVVTAETCQFSNLKVLSFLLSKEGSSESNEEGG